MLASSVEKRTDVCLQQFADDAPVGQPNDRPATPWLLSGMVAVETEMLSYAQVATVYIVDVTSTLHSPFPSPAPAAQNPTAQDCAVRAIMLSSGLGHKPGGSREKLVKTAEAAAEGAFTATRPVSDILKVLVKVTSGEGAPLLVALADRGASTSLITRGVAERISLIVRDSDIELTGLSGPAITVGEASVGLWVSGVDSKLQVRVIVVEDLPEGQEMTLACADLKAFGLIHLQSCRRLPKFGRPQEFGRFQKIAQKMAQNFCAILKLTLRPSSQSWNWVKTSNGIGGN